MAERKRTGRSNTPTELEEALRRHVRAKGADYLKDPNITSVGVGLKNGNGPVCLQFTVGEKGDFAIEALASRRIPETIDIEGHSVPTDVSSASIAHPMSLSKPKVLTSGGYGSTRSGRVSARRISGKPPGRSG